MTKGEQPNQPIRFGVFELDLTTGELRRRGIKVSLQEQPFHVLSVLILNQGAVVTREDFHRHLHPSATFGDFDHGLHTAINKIRKALGDSATHPRFIETLPRRGYRFLALTEPTLERVSDPHESGTSVQKNQHAFLSGDSRVGRSGWRSVLAVICTAIFLSVASLSYFYRSQLLRFLAASPTTSVAVLPFVDLSLHRDQEYLSDGLTEELISSLSRVRGLHVVARTSSFYFKGKSADVRNIGKQLNVNAILEGSVRQSGDRLRITTKLIDVRSGYQLWSETFDRTDADIFAIQDATSHAVIDALRIHLIGSHANRAKPRTVKRTAYNLYLQGRYFLNKRTKDDLVKAIHHFRLAAVEDPAYAPTYAGLADAYGVSQNWGELAPATVFPEARLAAAQALKLDGSLADAHLSFGHLLSVADHDWNGAAQEFRRALELNPESATAHHWYAALYLNPVGRLEESLSELRRAEELDPLAPTIMIQTGEVLRWLGRKDEAKSQFRKALDLNPNSVWAYEERALVQLAEGRPEEAMSDLECARAIAPHRSLVIGRLAYCYTVLGRQAEAKSLIKALRKERDQRYVSPYALAVAYSGFDDSKETMFWLDATVKEHDAHAISLGVDPFFAGFYKNSMFVALLQKMKLR